MSRCHCRDYLGMKQPESPCALYTDDEPPVVCSVRATRLHDALIGKQANGPSWLGPDCCPSDDVASLAQAREHAALNQMSREDLLFQIRTRNELLDRQAEYIQELIDSRKPMVAICSAAAALIAHIGYIGEVNSKHGKVQELLSALEDYDGWDE